MNVGIGSLRKLRLSGGAAERGRTYGEEARALVAVGIDGWKGSIERELGVAPESYLGEFLAATSFIPAMQRWTPWVLDEIDGLAEGAGVSLPTMLAYNLPDEEWWYRQTRTQVANGDPRGCSVVGLRYGPNGVPIAAQNMDVPSYYAGTELVLEIEEPEGFHTTVLAYAGSTGLCGWNDAGVSICCNTLLSLPHSETGLPVNCVVRGVLAQMTLAAAREFATSVPHASGQAYLLGGSGQLAGMECGASGCVEYGADGDWLWHTNHPIAIQLEDAPNDAAIKGISDSVARGRFLAAHLPELRESADVEALLADRTVPLCRIPDSSSAAITFGAIVMELATPPRVELAPGPPDRTPFVQVAPPEGAAE